MGGSHSDLRTSRLRESILPSSKSRKKNGDYNAINKIGRQHRSLRNSYGVETMLCVFGATSTGCFCGSVLSRRASGPAQKICSADGGSDSMGQAGSLQR